MAFFNGMAPLLDNPDLFGEFVNVICGQTPKNPENLRLRTSNRRSSANTEWIDSKRRLADSPCRAP